MNAAEPVALESLHPSLWRASQLARSHERGIDTGYATLSAQLPGGGWPAGVLVDVLLQQPGIGEVRLLAPALANVAGRGVVLVDPPHAPQAIALAGLGLAPANLVLARTSTTADALWTAEQVLRSGSAGALLFWQKQIRSESLRRLHLAAQHGETLFFLLRPLSAAQDPSPAPLRVALRPRAGGIEVDIVKRRGPLRAAPLVIPLPAVVNPRAQPNRHPHEVPAQPVASTVAERTPLDLIQ